MITHELVDNDSHNWIKTWCETCAKILLIDDAGVDGLNPLKVNLAEFEASHHERHHPEHDIYVIEHQIKKDGNGNSRVA